MANSEEHTEKRVEQITAGKIRRILELKNEGQRKAILANLRRGAGRTPGELPELWGEFLEGVPEDLCGTGKDDPNWTEWAVYTALTLFALHQQGHDCEKSPMHKENIGLGTAVAQTVSPENVKMSDDERKAAFARVRRRFNIVATASSMEKLSWHLRGLIQLISSQSVGLDYGRLARDLYLYQIPAVQKSVRLQWGRDLYREYYRYYSAANDGRKDNGEAND